MFEGRASAGKFVQLAKATDGLTVAQVVGRTRSVMEPKYDGHRILIGKTEQGNVRVFARSGEEKTGRLPKIEAEAHRILTPGTWIDGETVGFLPDGTQDWGLAQSGLGSHAGDTDGRLTFVAFDILSVGGTDARPATLEQRRQVLEAALKDAGPVIQVTPQMEATDENYERLLALGFEGAITKDLSKPYASGKKGAGWNKHKATRTADVVVMGFTEGNGSISGLIGAIEYGQVRDGVLVRRGKCSGMTMAERVEMSRNRNEWVGRVIEMKYQTITTDGSFLFPRFLHERTDKGEVDCIWDAA
jgi:ATP-dependent DNA ligase